MSRENDDAVLQAIGQITVKMDYDNPEHLGFILNIVRSSDRFVASDYGKRYISWLEKRLEKLKASSEKTTGSASPENQKAAAIDSEFFGDLIRQSDEKTESLFRDIDESMFQVASQRTSQNTQKLVWVILGLCAVNTVIMFFVALFVWKLNMG